MARLTDLPPEIAVWIGSYCDKATISSIVSVCVQAYNNFNVCKFEDFRARGDAGRFAYHLQTLVIVKLEMRITPCLSAAR